MYVVGIHDVSEFGFTSSQVIVLILIFL